MITLTQTTIETNNRNFAFTAWSKVEGKERIYITRDNNEIGYYDVNTKLFVKSGKGFAFAGGAMFSPQRQQLDQEIQAIVIEFVEGNLVKTASQPKAEKAEVWNDGKYFGDHRDYLGQYYDEM